MPRLGYGNVLLAIQDVKRYQHQQHGSCRDNVAIGKRFISIMPCSHCTITQNDKSSLLRKARTGSKMDLEFKLSSLTFTYLLSCAELCRLVYLTDEFFYFPSAPPITSNYHSFNTFTTILQHTDSLTYAHKRSCSPPSTSNSHKRKLVSTVAAAFHQDPTVPISGQDAVRLVGKASLPLDRAFRQSDWV